MFDESECEAFDGLVGVLLPSGHTYDVAPRSSPVLSNKTDVEPANDSNFHRSTGILTEGLVVFRSHLCDVSVQPVR